MDCCLVALEKKEQRERKRAAHGLLREKKGETRVFGRWRGR